MKRVLAIILMMGISTVAVAQEKEVTNIKTETQTVASSWDLLNNWNVSDASSLTAGHVHLRLRYNWVTSEKPANNDDENDDHQFTPAIVWGIDENLEWAISVPYWFSEDGQDRPGELDGNWDTFSTLHWRFLEQDGNIPAMAVSTTLRIPTGDESNKMDLEGRLIFTNQWDSGIRSHFNAFGTSVNGDNDENARHFQWGFVLGADGPLCDDGSVRWVADLMHRSSYSYGRGNINQLELGWEWAIDDANALGMSVQLGLDGEDEGINAGIGLVYSHTLGS